MIYAIIILSLIFCLALLLWSVDIYQYVKKRMCRYHIGRWPNPDKWQRAVIRKATAWTINTPTVKITDNSRYVLLDVLQGCYRSRSIQAWQNAALILGLLNHNPTAAINSARSYLTPQGTWKVAPHSVDVCMLGYAILQAIKDKTSIKPAMDTLLDLVRSNTDEQGLISYCGGSDNKERYVDLLGLVCPFLMTYAVTYQHPEYAELALKQIRFYHDYGLYDNTILPCHAIQRDSHLPLGIFGWGRGTVWYTLALADTYKSADNETQKKELLRLMREAADAYLSYQHADGGFGCILQRSRSYDSSATAGLAYFYRICSEELQPEPYASVSEHCLNKLRIVTRLNGAIDWCQGDTKDIGVFAQTYDVMPFAQGMALRALPPVTPDRG